MKRTSAIFWLSYAALLAGLGWLAWDKWGPQPAPVEQPAPQSRQADGSLILERKINPQAKPAHAIPKGAKVERTGKITMQPRAAAAPIDVDWSLVRNNDNSHRMITSSPDGTITGGDDIVVDAPPPPRQWAAGLSYVPTHQTSGIWLDRDFDRVRVGVEINQVRSRVGGETGIEGRVKLGFSF